MPKGFTDSERAVLRRKLIAAGGELFGRYGFKKAGIDQVCDRAGISKGAFYLFFDSKEIFFFEVIESIEREFRAEMLATMKDKGMSPAERLKMFFLKFDEFMERNPIMSKIRLQDMGTIMLNLPPEKLEQHKSRDINFMFESILKAQKGSGRTRRVNPKALSGFFMFFFFIFQHKNDIEADEYRAGIEMLIEMACEYFFKNASRD